MTQQGADVSSRRWYVRPVVFVTSVQLAIEFYLGKLGFEKQWHEADGTGGVCQIHRAGCEIILCEEPDRRDRGRLYIELTREGFDLLLRQTVEQGIPTQKSWWGNDVVVVADPDGNELMFPRPGK